MHSDFSFRTYKQFNFSLQCQFYKVNFNVSIHYFTDYILICLHFAVTSRSLTTEQFHHLFMFHSGVYCFILVPGFNGMHQFGLWNIPMQPGPFNQPPAAPPQTQASSTTTSTTTTSPTPTATPGPSTTQEQVEQFNNVLKSYV